MDLRLSDHFLYTTNFFDLLQQNVGNPGSGALQQPNQSVITPLAKRISNLGTAEMNYRAPASSSALAALPFAVS